MTRYIARRILQAIPLLLGIVTLVFIIIHLAPGDPTARYLQPSVPPEVLEQLRRNWGLDQPIHVQYIRWLKSFFTGDLGVSLAQNRPITSILAVSVARRWCSSSPSGSP